MKKTICLFEDERYPNLLPLVYLRPVYDLRCGILTLREKVANQFKNAELIFHCRGYLENVLKERYPKSTINLFEKENITFINGRLLINKNIAGIITKLKENTLLKCNDIIVAANLSKDYLTGIFDKSISDTLELGKLTNLPYEEINTNLINYPCDLVNNNGIEIGNDYKLLTYNKKSALTKLKNGSLINRKNIFIGKNTQIDPFVVLDASEGPIYIGNDVRIMSHSTIQGPVFIGNNSTVKMHAAIYHNTSIGETCKIGGEIESSIVHSFSNKQHEGFLGHAYLGSWVNIGASTNNSDLKNNYENVEVYVNHKLIDSGSQFVGLIMGDHSKTAINTMFNTGTVVGVSCNIFGAGFPNKYLPSFSWGGSQFLRTYDISKSLEVAEIVMHRRNITLSNEEKILLKKIYEITQPERTLKKMG